VSDGEPRYYRSTDGLDLAYRHYGRDADGLPVVCLPGITRNSRDFEDLAATLAARRPVICPDFRGRGFSAHDPEWRNYRPPTYVRDVLTLLDTLDVARAAFIGTSLGGLVSMLLADASRDRVAGIVLNDIGPVIGPEGLERIKGYIGRAAPVATWDEAVSQAKEIYEIAWPGLSAADWQRIVRRAYREDASGRPVLDMDPMVGDAARTVGTGIEDPWALFRGLAGLPLLVLRGETSDILTAGILADMQSALPDLEAVVVPDRGHVPLLDEPEALGAIESFLEALDR